MLPCLVCCYTPLNVTVPCQTANLHCHRPFAFRTTTPATQPQLQDFSNKQQQLELQYRPVVAQLPALLEQLRPEELSQAAEFAALEGMREPLLQVRCAVFGSVSVRVCEVPSHTQQLPSALHTQGMLLAACC